MGLSLCVGCWRRYTVPLLECHPELVSGSHYSIYPLVLICKIYEMLKRVQHDSLVWGGEQFDMGSVRQEEEMLKTSSA